MKACSLRFLIGQHFELETDHKPLLSLLGVQALDTLPLRIQHFLMRLMGYLYTMSHVAGKDLLTVDTLSRAPLRVETTRVENELTESTNIYVDSIMDNLPASSTYMDTLRENLRADSVCSAKNVL